MLWICLKVRQIQYCKTLCKYSTELFSCILFLLIEALIVFIVVQIYMGDRRAKKNPIKVALEIVSRCWTSPPLRDELYIQLARQTTGNSNAYVKE
jgi:hypothetical protein